MTNLDPETLRKLLVAAGKSAQKPDNLEGREVKEEKKDAKLQQGLQQILGGATNVEKKPESNQCTHVF